VSKCLITGCRFVIAAEGRSLWGDLHSVSGEVIVFNGVTRTADGISTRQAYWDYVYPTADKDERQVLLKDGADYFEKRGIITCRKQDTQLNETSKKYLGDR
jgi:hypothetical protein